MFGRHDKGLRRHPIYIYIEENELHRNTNLVSPGQSGVHFRKL